MENSDSSEASGSVENSKESESTVSGAETPKNDAELLKDVASSIDELNNIDIKSIGATYLLKHISDSIGLTNILKKCFPSKWRELLALTFFTPLNQTL
ncbi:MAG: hypothetical protein LBR53_10400 [Deltaproteobacteria bacterium]|nr:hypothetical protein [Deltaproteobacteria bacterium]